MEWLCREKEKFSSSSIKEEIKTIIWSRGAGGQIFGLQEFAGGYTMFIGMEDGKMSH